MRKNMRDRKDTRGTNYTYYNVRKISTLVVQSKCYRRRTLTLKKRQLKISAMFTKKYN